MLISNDKITRFLLNLLLISLVATQPSLFGQELHPTRHIPIIESPAAIDRDYYVILLSGNGGWRKLVQSLTRYLNDNDISVVAINTKKYLLSKKKPDQIACDLEFLMDKYDKKWDNDHVVLLGYSMGAEIIPFVVNRLTDSYRDELLNTILIGPWETATFRIRLADYFMEINKGADVYAELGRLKDKHNTYIICDNKNISICNKNLDGVVDHDLLGGGHHFGGDYQSLSKLVGKRLKLE
jgi:type IV secretory pathway VirJ component